MNFFTVFLLALALSADAFTVSLTDSLAYKNLTKKNKIFIALCFGFFQGLMPCIGSVLGNICKNFILKFSHILALFILSFIGINMIYSAFKSKEEKCTDISMNFSYRLIFMEAIATSIDALSVGIALTAENINIIYSAGIIAFVTTFICILAFKIGKKIGDILKDKAEIIGGVILILIGLKLFFQI